MSKTQKRHQPRQSKGQPAQPKPPKLDALAQINHHAAGLDIGDAEIYAAVPESAADPAVRVFRTFTPDLQALADWLAACKVDTVAMESTGVYWIPIYELLEERGFQVYLVNARQLKNVSGKKTDILDCQWIQQLHTYGLLQPSFRPPEEVCALRALVRQRGRLIQSCSAEIQHMQKALQQMNLKLTKVLSDVTGTTGLAIIRDIVAGERDPHKLAAYRDPHCRKSEAEIAAALTGNYKREHLFALSQALQAYDFFSQQIAACDVEIAAMYQTVTPPTTRTAPPLPPRTRPRIKRQHEPAFDLRSELYHLAGVDLTAIDGVEILTVQAVLTETGVDMSRWPTVKHFTSWLGLCPENAKTGGKIIKHGTKPSANRAAAALRLAAQSLIYSDSALGAYCRRMRSKLGKAQAITATAHKLARIIYAMLKTKTPYKDPGADHLEAQVQERKLKNLKRQAKELGYELTPSAA
jgi:transposase